MGFNTFKSLGYKPLPKRKNVILTRNKKLLEQEGSNLLGYEYIGSLKQAFEKYPDGIIIGGVGIIEEAIKNYGKQITDIQFNKLLFSMELEPYMKPIYFPETKMKKLINEYTYLLADNCIFHLE
jgi:dihydrofolate reductase